MPDDLAKEVLGTAATWLGGTGAVAALGVFLKGLLSGTLEQERDLREAQAEEIRRLRPLARAATEWRYLCFQARLEAERLGHPPQGWPPGPEEESRSGDATA